ncbi:mitogen-activated protein kinase kinase kinase YODA-like [Pyrus ussuriensis x Pyrus communis]|uniref:Mitogen-activated protein kinase kinase kinase YODA-like n=1 Tax=Pyrus ussuriensis x Pyrus communis TaxID=2448454 RepID=A0A5N5GYL1_9ROSA|nr:mitogen-activated protein kinase kinase kinase YODA-like [Pyrus ussuriensis x Pyrus communis]
MSSSTFFCVSGSKRCSGGGCCEQSPRRKLHHSNPELGSPASATFPEFSVRKSHSLDWGVAGAAPQPLPLPESSLIQRPDAVPKQGHDENQVATASISGPLTSYSGCIHPDENSCGGCFNFCLPTKTQANDISSHTVSPRRTNAAADPLPSFGGPQDHYQNSFPSRLSPKGQSRSLGHSPLHSPPSRSQRFNPKGSNGTAVTESGSRVNAHPLPLPPPPQSSIMHNNAEILPVSSIKGQWKKGKLIGRGTLGSVYLATNRETGALCAMKEVDLIPDDPKSAECVKQLEQVYLDQPNILQEIKILRTLKHPNIVQYYGSEVIDNHFCTYLEYVYIRPGAIDKYVQDHIGAMTESVVRNFTRHILSGLAFLHGTKIIHRDIRGANLRLDASGIVKIVNFGIAKHLNRQSDKVSLKGSLNWMAPEVIRTAMQNNADPDLSLAVDIWSLGCTIIEMFTGKPPWSECTGPQVMFKMLNRIPDIPETLSAEGKDFLHWCFRRDPAKRPSAAELLEHPFVHAQNP